VDPDVEARAREIVLAAKAQRRPLPRGVWIASFVVSIACVIGLAIAWLQDRNTPADRSLDHRPPPHDSGLWLGLLVGIGLGIAIGSVLAARRHRD
jgi:ABC-type nitrate/sulfonate/bicarbonate transport system permease component